MSNSLFDTDAILQGVVSGKMSTEFIVVPEGSYTGSPVAMDVREIETKNGPRAVLEITYELSEEDNQKLEPVTGRKKNTARQTVWLDLDENGKLDTGIGKNIDLGRLREATGQNTDGPWSPQELIGQGPFSFEVEHSTSNERVYANVKPGSVGPVF